ncbi:hypothetical protein DBR11_19955 [Pedobacter sp. HMWF019]|uniref:hypothetical protein n=1 Tax=Pedobacter sp. HMWF019 TaxID=2056856 RepID=UPI000D34C7B6|nr:hypothetical protein [Pedobacter sp. HMWF019]PTS96013.1 hypothetical protein DBR11_19955 [Pedobacter sp. HMWF019]
MELKDIITNSEKICAFIESDFTYMQRPDNLRLIVNNHYLVILNYNMGLKANKVYTLFDAPIRNLNALRSGSEYCLYLKVPFSKNLFNTLISLFGIPDNATIQHVSELDFDSLFWLRNKTYEIGLTPSFDGTNDTILLFTTFDYDALINRDSIQ